MADMLLCTRFDVSDLLLDTFRVCTGQDNHYLIEVESIGLTPVFQLISQFYAYYVIVKLINMFDKNVFPVRRNYGNW
jgi:hypothetical protein